MSEDGRPPLPDARPFRRIQLGTALLIAAAALVTLLSDERPGAVRWGTLVGLAVLALMVVLVTRRRRGGRAQEDDKKREKQRI